VTFQNPGANTNFLVLNTDGGNRGQHTLVGKLTLDGIDAVDSGRSSLHATDRGYLQFEPTGNGADYFMGVATDETTFIISVNNGSGQTGFEFVGAIATSPSTASLTADNQTVICTNKSYIQLSSNSATASQRTFVLTPTVAAMNGQILTLEWTGTNAGEIADDSSNIGGGNTRLSAVWTPTQYDTLTLRFNGTDWVEMSRSTN
jgi:hypothetical protein